MEKNYKAEKHYCIFAANYLPNLGGVERYTYNLSKELIARRNKVTIVTSNIFSLPPQEKIDGIEIFRMPSWKVLNGRFPIAKYNATFYKLDQILRAKAFDFVIVQTRFYLHSLYGVSFAKKLKIPCITIEHGTNHFTVNNRILDFLGHIYEHAISRIVRRKCRHFYGVSQSCCDWLRHFKINPEGILYNAIDLNDIFRKRQKIVESYRETLLLKDKTIITYAGRLVREKGVLKLIEAVVRLQQMNPNLALIVAGDGDLYEHISQRKLPQVYILGMLDFAHIISLLEVTDIFCLPTDYPEGFPTSVLEAAACECYIITTANGGSKELIIDESFGMILSENTVEKIMEAIEYAAVNEEYREKAIEKTYSKLCQQFTWKSTADEVIRIAGAVEHD